MTCATRTPSVCATRPRVVLEYPDSERSAWIETVANSAGAGGGGLRIESVTTCLPIAIGAEAAEQRPDNDEHQGLVSRTGTYASNTNVSTLR